MPSKYRAAVCGIARDEDRYIVEWLAYHLAIGFEHIFLYDNMSVTPIASLIDPKILDEKVTVIRWPSLPGESAQLAAYRHFLHTYQDWVEWAAVLDLDEFLNLKKDRSIHDFLDRFPDASAISINWRLFGGCGETRYRKAPMIERFPKASEVELRENTHVKTIHRLDHTTEIHIHSGSYSTGKDVATPSGVVAPVYNFMKPTDENYDVAAINHYMCKSRDEWVIKSIRGYCDDTVVDLEDYDRASAGDVAENSIQRRLPALHRMMRRVRRRKGIVKTIFKLGRAKVMAPEARR